VPGREILLGGGNVHCITQQVPAGGAQLRPRLNRAGSVPRAAPRPPAGRRPARRRA
jgi:hypothetical protein